MFTSQIRFGTDGWRSRMDRDFNVANVRRLAYAVGKYLENVRDSSHVLVSYDTRMNSDVFARNAAWVLRNMKFRVLITPRPTPTPVIAFSVVNKKSLAAIQITASHNPPIYNGFKFIPDYGGPAFPEITKQIEGYLPEGDITAQETRLQKFNPKEQYFSFLTEKIDVSMVERMKIVIDPLYGAGFGYLSDLLKRAGAKIQEIHGSPNPNFGGLSPEPSRENTKELAETVVATKADMGIANDGDADRFAAVDHEGNYYSSNNLVLIIADYLFRVKGIRGKVVRSVSTTSALDRLCAKYGIALIETPVGFKYLARELMDGAVLGAEESGGLGFGWSVPEKDGIMSGALLCEAISHDAKTLKEAWEDVAQKYGYHMYLQYNLPLQEGIRQLIEKLRTNPPDKFAGRVVLNKITIDGLKLVLEDGSWVLLRPSGTEPLIRIYIEANNQKEVDELKLAVQQLVKA
jgi:phosphomannomutase